MTKRNKDFRCEKGHLFFFSFVLNHRLFHISTIVIFSPFAILSYASVILFYIFLSVAEIGGTIVPTLLQWLSTNSFIVVSVLQINQKLPFDLEICFYLSPSRFENHATRCEEIKQYFQQPGVAAIR